MSRFIGTRERIEVRRWSYDAMRVAKMLESKGFKVRMETHCGFVLVHFTFPVLKLVK